MAEVSARLPDALPDVELFNGAGSPYEAQVQALAIPKYPLSENTPYMLMEGLTAHQNDSRTRFLTDKQLEQFLTWCVGDPGVMVGVSGIGKTRTVFEALAVEYGLYFVVDTDGNGGIRVSAM